MPRADGLLFTSLPNETKRTEKEIMKKRKYANKIDELFRTTTRMLGGGGGGGGQAIAVR